MVQYEARDVKLQNLLATRRDKTFPYNMHQNLHIAYCFQSRHVHRDTIVKLDSSTSSNTRWLACIKDKVINFMSFFHVKHLISEVISQAWKRFFVVFWSFFSSQHLLQVTASGVLVNLKATWLKPTERGEKKKRVMVWGLCVCVCVNWRGEELESPQCRCNPGPSATLRQLRAGPARGSDRGGWRVRSSHPAGLLLRSGAGNLDRKLDLCPAEPGQQGSEAARGQGSQRGRGAELRMTNMFSLIHSFLFSSECLSPLSPPFSHCTDPRFCDQLSLPRLPPDGSSTPLLTVHTSGNTVYPGQHVLLSYHNKKILKKY